MPPYEHPGTQPVLRDDIEVVILGERFMLCVGNDTYELPGPDARHIARLVDLLSAGHSPEEAANLLGLAEVKVAEYVKELAGRGCFKANAQASQEPGTEAISGHVGIVGVDATSLAVVRLLQPGDCKVLLADWRPWTERDALSVPGSERFVGRSRLEVAKALIESDQVRAGRSFSDVSPWTESFTDWLKDKSLVVVSTGYLSPATHEVVNARCGERRIPWMGIRHGSGYTEIGPPVLPPSTPCYVCLALRVLLNRSSWSSGAEAGLRVAAPIPLTPREKAEMAGLIALGEMRNLASRKGVGPSTQVVRIDWSTNEVSRLPLLKLPNCPGCEWWSIGGVH